MRVEPLRYFLTIAQLGSFSAAARRLYLSQQGLSKSVQALERELGVRLFERSGRKVHLTEAGRALVPLARACVESEQALREGMRHFSDPSAAGPHVALPLTVMPFAAGVFALMRDELEACGLRDVRLVEKGLPEAIRSLIRSPRGAASPPEIAMIVAPSDRWRRFLSRPGARIAFDPLFEAQLGVMGTSAHLSPRLISLSPADAAALPFACYSEPLLDGIVERTFADHPLQNVVMHTSNLTMIDECLAASEAVTFSDSFSAFANEGLAKLLFVPLEGSCPFEVGFACRADKELSPAAREYAQRFRACFQESYGVYFSRHPLRPSVRPFSVVL